MTSRATEDALGDLHNELAKILKDEIRKTVIDKEGNAVKPAAILNVARQFLKDNCITATLGSSRPLKELADSLPSFDDEEISQPGTHLN